MQSLEGVKVKRFFANMEGNSMAKKWIAKTGILTLMVSAFTAVSLYASPEQMTEQPVEQNTEQAAEQTAEQAEPGVKTYGKESETTDRFEFVNDTGSDIAYLNIRPYSITEQDTVMIRNLQTALIKEGFLDDVADGEVGPLTRAAITACREKNGLSVEPRIDEELLTLLGVDDGNILESNEVLKAGEQIIVYYEESADETQAAENESMDDQENYLVAFRLADDAVTEYILHDLPPYETCIHISLDGSIPYAEFQAEGSEEMVSTLQDETSLRRPTPQDFLTYD